MHRHTPATILLPLALVALGCRTAPPAPSAAVATGPRFVAIDEILIAPDDSAVAPLPAADGRPVLPRYPAAERQAGAGAWPIVAYVVDTTGRIEPRTLTFLPPAPRRTFREEFCAWTRRVRFTPARVDGIARRALIVQPFSFEVSGGERRSLPDAGPWRRHLRGLGPVAAVAQLDSMPHCTS